MKKKEHYTKSAEYRQKQSARMLIHNPMFNKESVDKFSEYQKENHVIHAEEHQRTCEYCGMSMYVGMYKRWHGAKCKENENREAGGRY